MCNNFDVFVYFESFINIEQNTFLSLEAYAKITRSNGTY
jgi:hypothetical protein